MSASISVSGFIKSSGVTVENEPIIKSDGAGAVTQWDNSTQDAGEGIYFVEGGSAGDPLRLGIGVAAPTVELDVTGSAKLSAGLTVGSLDIGHGAGGATTNTALGTDALDASHAASIRNTAIGSNALGALNSDDADYNTAVGANAGFSITSGKTNTAVGDSCLYACSTGDANTAVGQDALKAACIDENTAIGKAALAAFTASSATAVGSGAADAATSASYLTAVGRNAAGGLLTGAGNTAIGYQSLMFADGAEARNVALGAHAARFCDGTDDCIAIGYGALSGSNWGYSDGDTANSTKPSGHDNIAIGSYSLDATTSGHSNVAIGHNAGTDLTTGYRNVLLGYNAGFNVTDNHHNIAIGYNSFFSANTGEQNNIAIGGNALYSETSGADYCIAIGYNTMIGQNADVINTAVGGSALFHNKSGGSSVAIGYTAGYANVDSFNTWVGFESGRKTGHAAANTTLGYRTYKSSSFDNSTCDLNASTTVTCDSNTDIQVGQSVTGSGIPYGAYVSAVNDSTGVTSFTLSEAATTNASNQTLTFYQGTGDSNTCIGYTAGEDLTTGSGNIFIGRDSGKEQTTGNYNVVIGNSAFDAANGSEQYNIAIGTSALGSETSGADYCVAIGHEALTNQNSNVKNTAIGGLAGDAITSGASNTIIGYAAGSAMTDATNNVVVGHNAMNAGNGSNNTCIGYGTGANNTTGIDNVIIGSQAGDALTDGPGNVLVGRNAGSAMTTGDYNVAIGTNAADAMTGDSDNNIAIGLNAIGAEASGADDCIGIGKDALANQNDASAINLAIGTSAGDAITNGTSNVIIGYQAGSAISTADSNTVVGKGAYTSGTGGANVAIGTHALDGAISDDDNVAIGASCMRSAAAAMTGNTAVGTAALFALNHNDGDRNVAIGHNAGRYYETDETATPGSATPDGNNTAGSDSIFIGYDTRSAESDRSNEIVIGHTAVSNGSNTITLGNDDVSSIHCNDTSIAALSDRRIKRDITDNNVGLDFVEKLATVNYKRLNPADWPAEIRSHRYRVEEHKELVTPAVEAADAVYEDVVVVEAREAVEEVTETIEHPAVEAVYEDVIIPAVEEVRGERHKYTETEVTETVTREEIVQIDGKWVKREVSEEVTRTERTPVYEECDVYNEDGTQCMCCVTEARDAVTEERQVVDENGDGVVGEDGNPVMETVEIEPAVEAVHEPMKHNVPVMEEYVVQAAQEERTERQLVSPAVPARTDVRVITPAEPAVEEVVERRLGKEAVEAQEAVYKTVTVPADERPDDDDTVRLGLVAQDVQTAMTEAGVEFDLVTTGANGKLAVKYSNLVIPLLKAVQELSAEVKALKG